MTPFSAKEIFTIRHSFPRSCNRVEPLERDTDCNSRVGIPAVVHVITVIHVGDVDIVVVVPVVAPVFGPGVNGADPIATVLEAGISTYDQKGQATDSESMVWTKISAVTIVRNAVPAIAAALVPVPMVGFPAL